MKYQRIVATRRGQPEVLQTIEDDLPEPAAGEVRVKVLASGVAFGDVIYRTVFRGHMLATPGYDIVGTADKLGAGVTTLAIGQVVAALPVRGGYAEYINIAATELVPVPDGLDPAEAVSMVLNYVTAYQLLHRVAHVKKGQRILIHGAAGGVGTALLQLGRLAEVEMYGTASKRKHQIIIDSTESRLLHLLISHTGQVLTTDMIIERVWGYDEVGDSGLVKTHIRHLRQKVEPDPNSPQYIMTVPGVGYTFAVPVTIEPR